MESREETAAGQVVAYCLIPPDLAPCLHELLRRHFADRVDLEVIVERRGGERRDGHDRRVEEPSTGSRMSNRRRVGGDAGRRIADRRSPAIVVDGPALPRRARSFAAQIMFVELLQPSGPAAEDLDTARLVSRIQAGDSSAFAQLYLRYFDRVYAHLRILLRDAHEAEDAAQAVFVKVLQKVDSYRRRPDASFRAWLFTIVRNEALDALRRKGRLCLEEPAEIERRRELPTSSDTELDVLATLSDREFLLFVERLPLSQRQVLVLRHMLDLTPSQIASVLDRTPNQVKMLQRRAHAVLRERLVVLGRSPRHAHRARVRVRPSQMGVLRERRFALLGR
jgi:RNA polymerase sigma-70 factor (ECF subfamily)